MGEKGSNVDPLTQNSFSEQSLFEYKVWGNQNYLKQDAEEMFFM